MSERYSKIPAHLALMLHEIDPVEPEFGTYYYPCKVELTNGQSIDFVYLCEADTWFRTWGVWPEHDPGKKSIKIEDIATVSESPSRLPVNIARQIYQSGESGMGYTIFTLNFADGLKQAYLTGNAVDFITYPNSHGPNDIVKVEPHVGRMAPKVTSPDYIWCLFS